MGNIPRMCIVVDTSNRTIFYSIYTHIVYDLNSVRPLDFELVAPMPEQTKSHTIVCSEYPRDSYQYVTPETLEKCIVEVPVCSGMGATKLKFWAPRS